MEMRDLGDLNPMDRIAIRTPGANFPLAGMGVNVLGVVMLSGFFAMGALAVFAPSSVGNPFRFHGRLLLQRPPDGAAPTLSCSRDYLCRKPLFGKPKNRLILTNDLNS